ncbi:hypothetical protein [Peptacetobacter sp.]|uniref:hypothetical protein n=1 Tax=Peptacetobacter sp. TaxID=2991975 RepID=UPI002623DF45|nr:hypothetical protein [Peptacetobacter sp.]
MSKIFYLFSNELRKSKYDYLFVIIAQLILWTGSSIVSIIKYSNQFSSLNSVSNIIDIINFETMGFSVFIVSFLYTIFIWIREFNLKKKSIYTIMMIPEKRSNIYFVKVLNALTMYYTNIILFTLFMVCLIFIISISLGTGLNVNPFEEIIYAFVFKNTILAVSPLTVFVPLTFMDLIITDIFVAISNIALISLAYLMNIFFMKKNRLLRLGTIIITIIFFLMILFVTIFIPNKYALLISLISIIIASLGSIYILKNIEM